MINAIALDDEPYALEVIKSLANNIDYLNLVGYYTNPYEAIDLLSFKSIDLIFLDINMPEMSGFDFINLLKYKPMIIFTTAHPEHAVTSYDVNAVDYLLKPFRGDRFISACTKANDLYKKAKLPIQEDTLLLKTGYESLNVKLESILFIESSGNYMTYVTNNSQRLMCRQNIQSAIASLPPNFVRVHRRYIVNKNKIEKMDRANIYIENFIIPMSSMYSIYL